MKPRFVLKYRARAWPDGVGYWLDFPDFPALSTGDHTGGILPETLAADALAHAIVDHLRLGKSLPMPTSREDGEIYVEPRFHFLPEDFFDDRIDAD